jgi:hypothetical protein
MFTFELTPSELQASCLRSSRQKTIQKAEKMMKFKFLAVVSFLVLMSGSLVFAQTLRGRIEGTVKDPQGQLVPNAAITAINTGTGEKLNAVSTADGTFSINEVKPGTYTISAEIQGFKKILIEGVGVQVGTVTGVTVQLELGTVSEQVNVSADDAQVTINTSTPEVGEVVDRQKILELPLDGRNPFELTALNAGVQTKSDSDGEVRNFSINGNRTVANNLTVDGVNASDNFLKTPANITLPVIPVSVESIAEFRVTTSLPSAEFGRGTAQINAVTASGTNRFRGSIFEFHRNTAFNANNFFNNSTILENGQSVPREPLIRNQFGGRLGGPIIKDKIFFFASYEGKRESRGLSRNRLVYTSQARQGIFRYLKNLPTTPANVAAATITAPAGTLTTQSGTCRATAGGTPPRTVIPNGAICVVNLLGISGTLRFNQPIDPVISQYLSVVPLPNNFQIGDGLNTGGFRFNSKVLLPTDQFTTRFDYRISDKHTFEATINYGKISFDGDYINEREPAFPDSDFGTRETVGRGFSGAFRSIITANIINEVRVGAQISGLVFGNTADYSRGYLIDTGDVFNPEYSNIGTGRSLRVLQFTDNLTILRGNHTFKMGAEVRNPWVRRYSLTGTLPILSFGTANSTGFSQTNQFFGSGATEYSDARELVNLLTGALSDVTQVFNATSPTSGAVPGAPEVRSYHNWETGLYFQDSRRFSSNLNLNLGVRYEYNTAPRELNNLGLLPVGGSAALYGISGDGNLFTPGVTTGTAQTILDFPKDGKLYNADKNNFAPVVGFAWDPFKTGKMSVRGGYRISYFQGSFNTIDGTLDDNEGLIITTTRGFTAGYLRDGFGTTPTPTITFPSVQSIQTNSTVDIRAFNENLKSPYLHDFNFGIQYEVFKGTSLEVRYVGNRGKKLYRGYDVNEVNIFARDPKTGQTILDAFKIAQTNLAVSRANGGGDNFAYNAAFAAFGSRPNPLMEVLFFGAPAEYTNTNYLTRLDQGTAGDFADYVSRVRLINGVRGASFFNAVARGDLPINFIRANPNVRGAQYFDNGSTSSYDSLQVELTRRLSGGLRFQASYTFAKGLSDFIGSTGDTNSFLTLRDTRREYAQFNNTHQFLANAIYQLPFGRNRQFLRGTKGILGALISGWQINGIVKVSSGDPLSLLSGRGTYNRNDRSASNTVDVVGNLNREQLAGLLGIRSTSTGVFYINPNFAPGSTANTSEVIFLNPQPGTIGSLGLSTIYGPRFFNFDFSTLKRTRINENMNIEFRAEIFNAFNTVNFDNPVTSINSANFGRITNIVGRPRVMQFGLRLNF